LTEPGGVANCFPLVTVVSTLQADEVPRLYGLAVASTLYVRGALGDEPSVAIVGARAASRAGMDRAFELASHLARRGIRVVSGGAIGIDAAAHRGALVAGGLTTVVLGSGIDVPYPARNIELFDAVVAAGGAVVSMFPMATQPRRENFPRRNRLIAALVDQVVVVEADVRSGSLSTARAATQLGRPLGATPGSVGCARLIATGVGVVETAADLDALIAGTSRRPRRATTELDASTLSVAEALSRGVRGVDAVMAATGLGVRDVLRAISAIETRMS
jgi:DNA processing protein